MSSGLEVDAAACDGVGICAVVARDLVTLDQWGFPVVAPVTDGRLLKQARRAVRACPHRALALSRGDEPMSDVGPPDQGRGSFVQLTRPRSST
jgi:ferredoxin